MNKQELLDTSSKKFLLVDIREDEEVSVIPTIPGAIHILMGC